MPEAATSHLTTIMLISFYALPSPQIDVAINAPKAGKIVEVFAKEDDTVAVGQDLYKLEPGEPGEGMSNLCCFRSQPANCVLVNSPVS